MGLHDGHRQRAKERYRQVGTDALADHELLELALFYAIHGRTPTRRPTGYSSASARYRAFCRHRRRSWSRWRAWVPAPPCCCT